MKEIKIEIQKLDSPSFERLRKKRAPYSENEIKKKFFQRNVWSIYITSKSNIFFRSVLAQKIHLNELLPKLQF